MTAKRITWKENDLVSLKLRDGLYTVAQMLVLPYMRFFKIKSEDGEWHDLDLNQAEPLTTLLVGKVVLQKLAEGKIKDKTVKPSKAPFEKHWLRAQLSGRPGFPFKGGDLVLVDPNVGTVEAPIVKADLSMKRHKDIIEKYELTNMWGSTDLAARLIEFFDTGRNHDPFKEKVFGAGD